MAREYGTPSRLLYVTDNLADKDESRRALQRQSDISVVVASVVEASLDLPEVMDTTLDTVLSVRDQVRSKADSARQLMFGPAYYAMGSGADADEESTDISSLQD